MNNESLLVLSLNTKTSYDMKLNYPATFAHNAQTMHRPF